MKLATESRVTRYLGGRTRFKYWRHVILHFLTPFRSHQGEREKNEYLIDAAEAAQIAP
jgi:hypothetical protein